MADKLIAINLDAAKKSLKDASQSFVEKAKETVHQRADQAKAVVKDQRDAAVAKALELGIKTTEKQLDILKKLRKSN